MPVLNKYDSSSDFVFKAIPFVYPTGYTVVMNCWFRFWDNNNLGGEEAFNEWLESRLAKCKLPVDHPFRHDIGLLYVGNCLIYNTPDLADAKAVYETFEDPDKYYVTFWENGVVLNENT